MTDPTEEIWELQNEPCSLCEGPLTFMGILGDNIYFRCRDCAAIQVRPAD